MGIRFPRLCLTVYLKLDFPHFAEVSSACSRYILPTNAKAPGCLAIHTNTAQTKSLLGVMCVVCGVFSVPQTHLMFPCFHCSQKMPFLFVKVCDSLQTRPREGRRLATAHTPFAGGKVRTLQAPEILLSECGGNEYPHVLPYPCWQVLTVSATREDEIQQLVVTFTGNTSDGGTQILSDATTNAFVSFTFDSGSMNWACTAASETTLDVRRRLYLPNPL